MPRAIELFEQVIAIDPDYASAYASLALALIWSDEHVSVRDPRVEAAVNRALALDPGNSEALTALGELRAEQNRQEEARELLEQAIANNPNNAFAYRWLGTSYMDADPVRYYALSRKAFEVNPLDPTIRYHLALAATMLGRYDDALAAAQGLSPGYRDQMAGDVHHHFGHLDKSLKSFYRAYRTWGSFGALTRELMMMKEYDLVEAWLREGGPIHTKVNLAAVRGEPNKAFRLWADAAEQQQDAGTDWTVGVAHIRFTGDFDAARELLERYLLEPGQTVPRFDPNHWQPLIEYALALQRTGSPERAAELIGDIRAFIETRVAAGVVRDRFDLNFQFWLSALHAMSGDTQQAVAALRHAAPQGGLTCTHCVRMWPHWENLRGDPEFDRVLAEVETSKAVLRQRLADEGMLLTPEEVLQLEEFSFDPFVN
ncbi:MAG: tetratricopeptide repeat protein [Gammaproteobacteria bacterium]